MPVLRLEDSAQKLVLSCYIVGLRVELSFSDSAQAPLLTEQSSLPLFIVCLFLSIAHSSASSVLILLTCFKMVCI